MDIKSKFDLCLVVDDDEDILTAARLALRPMFHEVAMSPTPSLALAAVAERSPDVLLLDANFARGATNAEEGLELLDQLLAADPSLAIVMITAHAGVNIAVEAMKRGAIDFISKPWSNERLRASVRTAASLRRSRNAAPTRQKSPFSAVDDGSLLGSAAGMARVHSLIAKAGPTEANVLILGENGTGKELVAKALHQHSLRAHRPMLTVDLGAVASELIDSELFGHVRGAFTDARSDRVGRLQAADGGTLFLDEIGNLPLHLQPKLLTALEQRRITPVGSNTSVAIDIRVVAATNMTSDMLRDPRYFRQDLLFRLNTVEIELPPLRDRREDVPELMRHYLAYYADRYARPVPEVTPHALAALVAYEWPGNVRALRHAAERVIILAGDAPLTPEDFSLVVPAGKRVELASVMPAEPADLNLEKVERRLIQEALRKHGYNVSAAASDLGLSRAALYRRMEKHGI